jgi:hypothetical protein
MRWVGVHRAQSALRFARLRRLLGYDARICLSDAPQFNRLAQFFLKINRAARLLLFVV